MSRFFEALKLANSSHFKGGDVQAEAPAGAFADIDTAPFPASGRRDTNGSASAAAQATVATVDPWVISPEQRAHGRRDPSHKLLFTALARASVDHNVRMIPNAVDRSVVEHYRRLRTKVMQQHAIQPFRSLLVTSASPQEGKSVTTLNLALSFAMLPSFRVLVVDGDMRRGTLGNWLGASDQPGFSNLIEGSASLDEVVYTAENSSIFFTPAGTSKTSAAELLHSSDLSTHIHAMVDQFDLVLIDSPPVNLITDTQLLAAHSDAVLLVARAFKTSRKSLEKAVQDLLPFRVIGTVMNSGTSTHLYRGHNDYY